MPHLWLLSNREVVGGGRQQGNESWLLPWWTILQEMGERKEPIPIAPFKEVMVLWPEPAGLLHTHTYLQAILGMIYYKLGGGGGGEEYKCSVESSS